MTSEFYYRNRIFTKDIETFNKLLAEMCSVDSKISNGLIENYSVKTDTYIDETGIRTLIKSVEFISEGVPSVNILSEISGMIGHPIYIATIPFGTILPTISYEYIALPTGQGTMLTNELSSAIFVYIMLNPEMSQDIVRLDSSKTLQFGNDPNSTFNNIPVIEDMQPTIALRQFLND